MNTFPSESLGNLCSLITDGKHGDCSNADNSGYYFISAKDIRDGRICYENARQIIEDDFAETHRRTNLKPGDLLITNSGTIGRLAIASDTEATAKTTFQKSVAILKPKQEKISSSYLYYSLLANKELLINASSGSVQKNLLLGELRRIAIPVPPLSTQKGISMVLSCYDSLIGTNRRRMALLEESARLLYQEWFVHLRFPGHEHIKSHDGLPEGWEKKRISDIADCVGGATPSTTVSTYWDDGTITWVTPTDVTRNTHFVLLETEKKITEAGLNNCSAKMLPAHAVLMTSRASVGFFALAGREVCTNQGFISIVPQDITFSYFLLFQLSERVEEIRAMGSGSTYPEVSRGKFREFQVVIPPYRLVTEFDEQASFVFKQIRVLKQQNQKLKSARDILLPRLMNGEIPV